MYPVESNLLQRFHILNIPTLSLGSTCNQLHVKMYISLLWIVEEILMPPGSRISSFLG